MSILDSAELLLQARNYSGSGNWLDEANSHDATPVNSPTFSPLGGLSYFTLNGSTQYFTLANAANLNFDDVGWSIIGVGQTSNLDTEQALYSKYDFSTGQEVSIRADDVVRVRGADGTLNSFDEHGTVTINTDFSAAGVFDEAGATLEAFRNGVESGGPTSLALADQTNTDTVGIGARNDGTIPFTGRLYAVAMWRSALTDAEVLEAHNLLLPSSSPYGLLLLDVG